MAKPGKAAKVPATLRVEITEPLLMDGAVEYVAGDVKALPRKKALAWMALGWAKDCDTGEQGARTPGANGPVDPDNVQTAMITR